MKAAITTIILTLLMSMGAWAEWSQEKTEYEMFPLQPPSANSLETAKGLMRCLNLYIASDAFVQKLCGLSDWRKENGGDILEFKNSKQFKTCGGSNEISEDYQGKLRSAYADKFGQKAHLIALEEGVLKETLYLNADEQVDTYYAMIQDIVLKEVKEIEELPPLLLNDLSTCMDYRDYVDLELKN